MVIILQRQTQKVLQILLIPIAKFVHNNVHGLQVHDLVAIKRR